MKKKKQGRPATPLGTARREFIERWVICPEIKLQEIADAVSCSQGYVIDIANAKGLLEQREANRKAAAEKMRRSLPKILLDDELK